MFVKISKKFRIFHFQNFRYLKEGEPAEKKNLHLWVFTRLHEYATVLHSRWPQEAAGEKLLCAFLCQPKILWPGELGTRRPFLLKLASEGISPALMTSHKVSSRLILKRKLFPDFEAFLGPFFWTCLFKNRKFQLETGVAMAASRTDFHFYTNQSPSPKGIKDVFGEKIGFC